MGAAAQRGGPYREVHVLLVSRSSSSWLSRGWYGLRCWVGRSGSADGDPCASVREDVAPAVVVVSARVALNGECEKCGRSTRVHRSQEGTRAGKVACGGGEVGAEAGEAFVTALQTWWRCELYLGCTATDTAERQAGQQRQRRAERRAQDISPNMGLRAIIERRGEVAAAGGH